MAQKRIRFLPLSASDDFQDFLARTTSVQTLKCTFKSFSSLSFYHFNREQEVGIVIVLSPERILFKMGDITPRLYAYMNDLLPRAIFVVQERKGKAARAKLMNR